MTEFAENLISFNGIDGSTGGYLTQPMTVEALADTARSFSFGKDQKHFKDLESKNKASLEAGYKLSSEFGDPSQLKNAGWGLIFPAGADPSQVEAILDAMQELLELRQNQAGKRYKIFKDKDGFGWPGGKPETTGAFLARHGTTLGPVDPNYVPAYLLLVADPQSIPYQFQYELDVDYFVGRIYFQELAEYARYAHSVALAEKGQAYLPRRAAFFGVANRDDIATNLSCEHLVKPLASFVQQKSDENAWGWQSQLVDPKDADKATLKSLLGGSQTPALLFSASHGVGWLKPNPAQYAYQGALVCQDWPGPTEKATTAHMLAAQDLPESSSPLGMIAVLFACYSAGVPYWNAYSAARNQERTAITERPFLAALPTRLLSHPNGGALAVIGHIERANSFSFRWGKLQSQTQPFRSLLSQLLEGKPIGLALDDMNLRYASLAVSLKEILEEARYSPVDPQELGFLWEATNDARGYAILGDPAVRLAVAPPIVLAAETKAGVTQDGQQAVAKENRAWQTGLA